MPSPLYWDPAQRDGAEARDICEGKIVSDAPRPYKCHLCPKAFQRLSELNRHAPVHTGAKPYVCPFCKTAFSVKSNTNRHMRVCPMRPTVNNGSSGSGTLMNIRDHKMEDGFQEAIHKFCFGKTLRNT
ncbi:hypothetical protein BS47DRAFT_545802 [Hydnum rufescens UP504]|uniref:C2H2-type domain-containing protein n=1 Tax=Hydnum rufescens UP504 TaxID=1448309 RepID=A0A9P6B4K9_9AGAM|nr:hypothetical protein BS47DRAFT_545802 [Hydnum rufescens UP504]